MVHALEAGTIVAVLAAAVGWYMVLRRQSFAGHTLSVMAFPGAAGAALAGLPTALGYYLACGAAALAMAPTRRPGGPGYAAETAAIGTVQTVGLAAGFLFLSLNHGVLGGLETLLFGTFLGITAGAGARRCWRSRRSLLAVLAADRAPAAVRDRRSRGGERPRRAGPRARRRRFC